MHLGVGSHRGPARNRNQHWDVLQTDLRVHESGLCVDRVCLALRSRCCVPKVIVNEETAHETQEFITKRLSAIKSQRSTGDQEDLALVIGPHCESPSRTFP